MAMEQNATSACGTPAGSQSPQMRDGNASPGPGRRRRLGGRACDLFGTLVLDGKRVPVGPCRLWQTAGRTVLSWTEADGSEKDRDISAPLLRQLLDEGLLQRRDGR
jgi:hypothetical protein